MATVLEQPSISDIIDSALAEGVDDYTIDELADKEDINADDLRSLLGDKAEGVSDEDLLKAYSETEAEKSEEAATGPVRGPDGRFLPAGEAQLVPASGVAPAVGVSPVTAAAKWDRPWAFHKDDGSQVSAVPPEFLGYKVQYKANGQPVARTLDELVRRDQRSEAESARLQTVLEQRNAAAAEAAQVRSQAAQAESDRKIWAWALQDPTGQRFQKLQEKFFAQEPQLEAPARVGDDPQDEVRGELFYRSEIVPQLQKLARGYQFGDNAAAPEVASHLERQLDTAFRQLIDAEGTYISDPRYGPQRLSQIINDELPRMLAEAGYKPAQVAAALAAPAADPKVMAENATLKAELQNLKTQMAKGRVGKAPGSGSGASVPNSGNTGVDESKMDSWKNIKKMLRDREETFGN